MGVGWIYTGRRRCVAGLPGVGGSMEARMALNAKSPLVASNGFYFTFSRSYFSFGWFRLNN
jgi:hypothetical protein